MVPKEVHLIKDTGKYIDNARKKLVNRKRINFNLERL